VDVVEKLTITDTKAKGYALREASMVKTTIDALEQHENALIICGAIHCSGLQQRLQAHGLDVVVLDDSKEPWARNPILKSINEGFHEAEPDRR
jgi:hypothetical protein